jgi:SAM-dependent methyltransferase
MKDSSESHISRSELSDFFRPSRSLAHIDLSPPAQFAETDAIQARSKSVSIGLHGNDIDAIANSHGSPNYSIIKEMLSQLVRMNLLPELSGIGIEVGSGIALLSCATLELDESKQIQGIIALEAVGPFVREGIPFVSRQILDDNSYKILPCYGVFENIPFESSSLDFGMQIESLHHAEKLEPAIREIARIIRPGGFFISIDRSWVDSISDNSIEEMLNHEYSREWLSGKNFDFNRRFTRRDNGEHEYRDREWKSAFQECGFELVSEIHLHPRLEWWHVKKRLACLLRIENLAGIKTRSRNGIIRNFLSQKIGLKYRRFSNLVCTKHPRPLTLLVLRKPIKVK